MFERYGRKRRRELFPGRWSRWFRGQVCTEGRAARMLKAERAVRWGWGSCCEPTLCRFNLSDPGVEEALYESAALRRFAGVDLGIAALPAPDETTICRFRHLLEKHDLGGLMLEGCRTYIWKPGASALRPAQSSMRPSSTRLRRPRTPAESKRPGDAPDQEGELNGTSG